MLVLTGAFGCADPALSGEECVDSADCGEGLSCFEHEAAALTPVCMPDCDVTMTRVCGDGAVCTRASGPERPADLGVCYFGGTTGIGSECTGNLECERGAICVMVLGEQRCHGACDPTDGTACAMGETCSPLVGDMSEGFCQTTP